MQDKPGSLPHNTNSQDEAARHEGELHASRHEHHHPHHLDTSAAQSKTSATLTAATSSMISSSINYNVNIQFDPVTPQASKPTNLSLIV
jgi:hypothetical protein